MVHRKTRGKGRKSRKSYKGRQRGGMAPLQGPESDVMASPSKQMLAQGKDFAQIHSAQHGGAAVSLANSAPVGDTGVLDQSLRGFARVGGLDSSMQEIQGMSDQSGGGRRKKGKKSRKSRKGRKGSRRMMYGGTRKCKGKSRKSRKSRRSSRRMMYGGAQSVSPSDYGAPGMLLSPDQEARALGGMNPEWRLAGDPRAFTPK
jgi:hypothetical protein